MINRWLYIVFSLLLFLGHQQKSFAQIITTIAGNGIPGFSGDGGLATSAKINYPTDLIFDSVGSLFFCDNSNHRIRKINNSGIITTVAGSGTQGFSGDGGQALLAEFHNPSGIAFDKRGNLFISDSYNHRIRKIDSSGIITTIAGNGTAGFSGDGGQAILSELHTPNGINFDTKGNLYISVSGSNRIRMIDTTGIITTVAGNGFGAPGNGGFSGDGGQAINAELNVTEDVVLDASCNLYIADFYNGRIRMVNNAGIITTVAGNGNLAYGGDGGQAIAAAFQPNAICIDIAGNLYIADNNSRIRKVNTSGIICTIAGTGMTGSSGDGGFSTLAELNIPLGLVFDNAGNLYFADAGNNRIRKITNAAQISVEHFAQQNSEYIIYPNPTKDFLKIEASKLNELVQIQIFDLMGNELINLPVLSSKTDFTIDLTYLKLGLYILKLKTINYMETRKIIKN